MAILIPMTIWRPIMRRFLAAATALGVLVEAVAGTAQAQPPRYHYYHHHRHVCHRERSRAGAQGAIGGAVVGGLLGGAMGHGVGAGLLGAGAGALAGHAIARSTVHC
jgi:uncharacterized protein YcfJ